MVERYWQAPPTVPLLQWLARGPLKTNLLQSIRLWVWLHLLYGEASLGLPHPFAYPDWRDRFFSPSHPKGEQKPHHPDPHCPCQKPAAAWLFGPSFAMTAPQWATYQQQASADVAQQTQALTAALRRHGQCPDHLADLLQTPLFAMTRRTLYGDLRALTTMSWLTQQGKHFYPVPQWPLAPDSAPPRLHDPTTATVFTQPDLAAIAESFSREIQGHRRFFVHVDYVVPHQKLDRVDDWQAALSALWQQTPIPPVRLQYQAAGATHPEALIVYPVCIYYFRRGPYLCGFGQVLPTSGTELDWRNYRLDRILHLQPLDWQDQTIPALLHRQHITQTLPTPEDIALRMEEAWGFDYYQPIQQLLLRFDPLWNERYIRDTLRHSTFKRVPYPEAVSLIRQQLRGEPQQVLLDVLQRRSQQDAYYTALYRQQDPNVHQRLRAWRPHVEVLLPWSLRQQFAAEAHQEAAFY